MTESLVGLPYGYDRGLAPLPSYVRGEAQRCLIALLLAFVANQRFWAPCKRIGERPDGADGILQRPEGLRKVIVDHGIGAHQGLPGLGKAGNTVSVSLPSGLLA
jgi:hypothetical protein